MKIEIKSKYDGSVLFEHEAEGNTLAITLRMAIAKKAYLVSADLRGVDLSGIDLEGANLSGTNLIGADLRYANLIDANIRGFKLVGERPFVQLSPIGSRCDYMMAFITDDGVKIQASLFFGGIDEFEKVVNEMCRESIDGNEYRAAIEFIRTHAKIWTPIPQL